MSKIIKKLFFFSTKYEFIVQCLQTGTLMSCGDILSQSILEDKSIYDSDLRRAAGFFTVGTIVIGPPKVLWLRYLNKFFAPKENHSRNINNVVGMVLVDQIFFAPFGLGLFLYSLGKIEGKSDTEIKQKFDKSYCDILVANYKIWPIVQLFNFYFIPPRHQVLFIQTIALVWNTYLSWRTHNTVKKV